MRLMSFFLTVAQVTDRSKTVTRRLGWRFIKPGDHVQAVVKSRGRKHGEAIRPLAVLVVTGVRRERLDALTPSEVVREGFPDGNVDAFLEMFCAANDCGLAQEVTVIDFAFV